MPGRLMAEYNVNANKGPTETKIKHEDSSSSRLPPEIEHITFGYQPLSKLFTRASQECFNSLNDLLADLADIPEQPLLNGSVPSQQQQPTQASASSARKRLRWLDFAHSQRLRFIKLLVLLRWTRPSDQHDGIDDVAKFIDIFNWTRNQENDYENAESFLAQLNQEVAALRIPRPDLESALQALASGTYPRVPAFGYIPPKPLSPRKLLTTLHNLNVQLRLRLNLHETLPPYFKDYRITSGRVTFTVPSEFEVDLSIAEDDPASQFFFIDFRLLCAPLHEIPAPQLRMTIEGQINQALRDEGLAGCFRILHDFVLTHKINLLRRQASALNRAFWAGSLRVEQHRRSLTVQYWSTRPGKKHWIEIGVRKPRNDQPSELSLNWMRDGIKTSHGVEPVDFSNIETILDRVIALHISTSLGTLYDHLEISSQDLADSPFLFLEESDHDPNQCLLGLPLKSTVGGTVSIEPVSGNWTLQPPSQASSRYETLLNSTSQPVDDPAAVIDRWRSLYVQHDVELMATNAGFEVTKLSLAADQLKQAFGSVLRASFFAGKRWKPSPWYLAFTLSSSTETWWLVHVAPASSTGETAAILSAQRYTAPGSAYDQIPWTKYEDSAVAEISMSLIRSSLDKAKIPWYSQNGSRASRNLQFNGSLLGSKSIDIQPVPKTFLEFRRLVREATVLFLVSGQLDSKHVDSKLLVSGGSRSLRFSESGVFVLAITVPLGSPASLQTIQSAVQAIARLASLVMVLKEFDITPKHVDPQRLEFIYDPEGSLAASLSFEEDAQPCTLLLQPANENPHTRIASYLSTALRHGFDYPAEALRRLVDVLRTSLPILRALDTLEAQDPRAGRLRVLDHATDIYTLQYPRLRTTIGIQRIAFTSDDWLVDIAVGEGRTEAGAVWVFATRIKGTGIADVEGVERLGNGWVGSAEGVAKLLYKIDAVARECGPEVVQKAVAPKPKVTAAQKPAPAAKAGLKAAAAAAAAATGHEVITLD